MKKYSSAITEQTNEELIAHLLQHDEQEDLCFAVWYPSYGAERTTALIESSILPSEGDRLLHGNASFTSQYFESAINVAMLKGGGLALIHSHLGPGWQNMSPDDISAEESIAAQVLAATKLPLVGLTLGTDGAWSSRFWIKSAPRTYSLTWCENVRVVGEGLSVTWHPTLRPPPVNSASQIRTISSWGEEAQANLARLRVGVIGAGSVGSIVSEELARTGVESIAIIDFDSIEEVNLDRLLHATTEDIGRAKISVMENKLPLSATAQNFKMHACEWSVVEEEGYRVLLDCDIVFSCVDRPWPRSVMNFAAYAHLVPVVDGGINVGVSSEGLLRRADWKAHIASPGRQCLECLGQFNPGIVSAERDGYFEDPTYIEGLPSDHPIKAKENVFAFSVATAAAEFLQFLMMVIQPLGIPSPGAQCYHFVPGILDMPNFNPCNDSCYYQSLIALGDSVELCVTGRHELAEKHRSERKKLLSK